MYTSDGNIVCFKWFHSDNQWQGRYTVLDWNEMEKAWRVNTPMKQVEIVNTKNCKIWTILLAKIEKQDCTFQATHSSLDQAAHARSFQGYREQLSNSGTLYISVLLFYRWKKTFVLFQLAVIVCIYITRIDSKEIILNSFIIVEFWS